MTDEVKDPVVMASSSVRFDDESHSEKLARKAKEAPFVPIGLLGFAGVVAYGAYKYKYRGGMSTSVFLMQLRVAAQGTVVACLTAGLAYGMARQYLFKSDEKKEMK
ncbi:hypothetical protein R5R35_007911 [Gryllus longicercus]|uniref:HIG1 domain-containing protein n=4 Tax=Gryllus longicercus TaxID=2509291 RepID=A0AAN9V4A3_9ORTH